MIRMTAEVAAQNPYLTTEREAALFTDTVNAVQEAYENHDMPDAGVMARESIESAMAEPWKYPVPVKDMLRGVANRGHRQAWDRQYQD